MTRNLALEYDTYTRSEMQRDLEYVPASELLSIVPLDVIEACHETALYKLVAAHRVEYHNLLRDALADCGHNYTRLPNEL